MTKRVKFIGGAVVALAALVGAVWLVSLLPDSFNPFKTENKDRSQPAVLQSIQDIGQYRAATANLQLVVDLEKDTRFVPDFLKGERTLFVAAGTVDAGVDLSTMPQGAVTVNDDRTEVTIALPAAQLYAAQVDLKRSSVIDKKRGILDRVGGLFGDGGTEQDVYLLAQRKLQEGAAADPRVIQRAEANTQQMLESLLRSLGFEKVVITFPSQPGT